MPDLSFNYCLQQIVLSTELSPPTFLLHVSHFNFQRISVEHQKKSMHGFISLERFVCSAEISFVSGQHIKNSSQLQPCEEFADGATFCQVLGTSADDSSSVGNRDNTCFVCMERPADAVLLECGHSGLCVECATVLWNQGRRCPLCRRGFAAIMRIIACSADTVSWAVTKRSTRKSHPYIYPYIIFS